jgi:hypothetical protein
MGRHEAQIVELHALLLHVWLGELARRRAGVLHDLIRGHLRVVGEIVSRVLFRLVEGIVRWVVIMRDMLLVRVLVLLLVHCRGRGWDVCTV